MSDATISCYSTARFLVREGSNSWNIHHRNLPCLMFRLSRTLTCWTKKVAAVVKVKHESIIAYVRFAQTWFILSLYTPACFCCLSSEQTNSTASWNTFYDQPDDTITVCVMQQEAGFRNAHTTVIALSSSVQKKFCTSQQEGAYKHMTMYIKSYMKCALFSATKKKTNK